MGVSGPSLADSPTILTPVQAQERIATLFSVTTTQVSNVHLEPSMQHGNGEYEADLPAGVTVRVDAVTGELVMYSSVASDDAETSWTLTAEQATEVARQFCGAKQIPIPSTFIVRSVTQETGVIADTSGGRRYKVSFVEKQGDIQLPRSTWVEVGGATGNVYGLGNRRDPLTISVDPPYLSLAQANTVAVTFVQSQYPTATSIVVQPGSILAVGWHPQLADQQYLKWGMVVGFDYPVEDGSTILTHTRVVVSIDARTSQVVSHYGAMGLAIPQRPSPTATTSKPSIVAKPTPITPKQPGKATQKQPAKSSKARPSKTAKPAPVAHGTGTDH